MILAMLDFRLAATLCDGVDTPGMVATLVKDSHKVLFSQPPISQIPISDIHVNGLFVGKIHVGQPLAMVVPPWHVTPTKFHELPTCPPIDRTKVLPDVVVVQNQEGIFQIGGLHDDIIDPKGYYWIQELNF